MLSSVTLVKNAIVFLIINGSPCLKKTFSCCSNVAFIFILVFFFNPQHHCSFDCLILCLSASKRLRKRWRKSQRPFRALPCKYVAFFVLWVLHFHWKMSSSRNFLVKRKSHIEDRTAGLDTVPQLCVCRQRPQRRRVLDVERDKSGCANGAVKQPCACPSIGVVAGRLFIGIHL